MKILNFLIFFFLTLPCLGQGFFFSENYTNEDYNSQSLVWDIAQDTNQYIHIGTADGIISYYGDYWKQNHIGEYGRGKSFYLAKDGTFYTSGFIDFGILEFDSVNKQNFVSLKNKYINEPLTFNQHHSINRYADGVLFYGSKGFDYFAGDSILHIPFNNVFKAFAPSVVFNDLIYAGAKSGLLSFDSLRVRHIKDNGLFKADSITVLLERRNRLRIASTVNGLIDFDGKEFKRVKKPISKFLSTNFVYTGIEIDTNYEVYGTLYGGAVLMNNTDFSFQVLNESTGLRSNQILSSYMDHENTIWLGTNNGLQKLLINTPIRILGKFQGLDFPISDFLHKKKVLFAKMGNQWYHKNLANEDDFKNLSRLNSSHRGFQHSNNVYFYNDTEIIEVDRSGNLRTIFSDSGIKSIFGTDTGIGVLKKEGFIFLEDKAKNFINLRQVGSIRESLLYKDDIVLNAGNNIYFINDDSLIHIPIDEKARERPIRINKMGLINGHLYIAIQGNRHDNGLYKYNPDSIKFYKAVEFGNYDSEITNYQVVNFEQCNNGDIWLNNNMKIKRIKSDGLGYKVMESPYQLIGENGIVHTIHCDSDGTVWFAGVKGIYHLNKLEWDYETDFKTNITNVYQENDSLIYGGFGELQRDVKIKFNENRIKFNFAATSYIDESRNTYSYKLEGIDKNWSEWSSKKEIEYSFIPEGDYLFKVKSRNVYEVEGTTDTFAFTILPPWYRTWWAYLLYLLLTSAILYIAYKIRVNQLLKVERIRTKIASDLHDEVSATLTGISYFAEAVKTNLDVGKKEHFMNLITESAGEAKDKISDIVWSISPENDDWVIFLSKCRRYASDLAESRGLEYDFKIAEFINGQLDMNVRQHLWMIFKEMLTNAVRHSNATRVDVIIDSENGLFKMIVQDDGDGFDISSKVFGNGLNNIKRRAQRIKAEVELDSELKIGTRWKLLINL